MPQGTLSICECTTSRCPGRPPHASAHGLDPETKASHWANERHVPRDGPPDSTSARRGVCSEPAGTCTVLVHAPGVLEPECMMSLRDVVEVEREKEG